MLQLAVYQITDVISSHVTEYCAMIEPQSTYTAVEHTAVCQEPKPFPLLWKWVWSCATRIKMRDGRKCVHYAIAVS